MTTTHPGLPTTVNTGMAASHPFLRKTRMGRCREEKREWKRKEKRSNNKHTYIFTQYQLHKMSMEVNPMPNQGT